MSDKKISIGFDRYLALEWANYSLELYLSGNTESQNYDSLKSYLDREIIGKESSRKTANQLKRLWLNENDGNEFLRKEAREILKIQPNLDRAFFHLGMALNAYPIFKEICRKAGELSEIQTSLTNKIIIDRVNETYLNPSSIPRIVSRVIQTLEDWGFIQNVRGSINIQEILIENQAFGSWLIRALMLSRNLGEISLREIEQAPEKMGIRFVGIRNIVDTDSSLSIRRNLTGEEVITKNSITK
jgi:hypothetical protein